MGGGGLLRELEGLPRELVVMLDDAHVLTNSALSRDVGLLVAHLPENVRFMIGARWDPPLPLRQLRMEGRLVQIRATDLAFDVDEAQQLVATVAERDVSGEQIATLVRRTDGWAVALQLAAISLQRAPDVGAFVEAFAGNDRLVVEYLTEEVLDRQDPATRRILLRTSVLGWLSAALCDAVTGEGNADEMLDFLTTRSLFLSQIDTRGERFRYHHLFADLLRHRLSASAP